MIKKRENSNHHWWVVGDTTIPTSPTPTSYQNPNNVLTYQIHSIHAYFLFKSHKACGRHKIIGAWVLVHQQILAHFSKKQEMGGKGKIYTLAEVSQHNTSKDCWLVIHGKVFCESSFLCDSTWGRTLVGCVFDLCCHLFCFICEKLSFYGWLGCRKITTDWIWGDAIFVNLFEYWGS